MKSKLYIAFMVAAAIAAVVGWMEWLSDDPAEPIDAATTLAIPDLSAEAAAGAALFERNCATCHGRNAAGSDQGPSLVHRIYEPNHHGDAAFRLAARNGVRAHHWRFGDMPPVDGVSDVDVAKITRYVRELQQENGIY